MASTPLPHPGFLIYDTVRLFRQCFGQRVQDLGMSEAQWRALGTIHKFEGISQTELAELLGIGKAPIGSLVDKLEQAGMLRREPDADDRRLKRLYLTDSARPVAAIMRQRYDQLEKEFTSGISLSQHAAMLAHLQRIYGNLSGSRTEPMTLMHLLTQIGRLFSRHFDEQLKQLGFTRSQWLVLASVHARQGIGQQELADSLSMQKAPLGALVNELERNHWVERRTDPADRRVRQLYLTEQCAARWPLLTQAYDAMHRKSIAGVSEAQRTQLRQSLHTIRDNLQSIANRNTP